MTVQDFYSKKPSSIAIAAFIEVMEHDEGPRVSDRRHHTHFRRCVFSIVGIDCGEDVEVLYCQEAMAVVHRDLWRDMRDVMVVDLEREGSVIVSPDSSNGCATVVSP